VSQMLVHSRFLKGVQAGFDRFAQPKGSIPRNSCLLYNKRGALLTCNGSLLLSAFNGALQTLNANFGAWLEIFLYQPIGAAANYFGIYKDYSANLSAPSGLTASATGTGVLTGVYKYVVTALDGAGGETTISNEVSVSPTTEKVQLNWTAVTNAPSYNVYRTVAGGSAGTEVLVPGGAGVTTNSYLDNTADGSLGTQTPPAVNNTQQCQFVVIPQTNYGAGNIIKTLPADALPVYGPPYGGHGGSSGHSGNQSPTMQGGIVGALSPLPMIVGFVNKMILALGNGITPYSSDGTTGNTIALTNTFSATYPAWAASTVYNEGDQIQATVGGTAYVFTAIQGGESNSSGAPSWPAGLGVTVTDGTGSPVIWKNTGQVSGSPVPRGAAHEEVYAGSLWVANTSPTETSDQLDGPSALRMSDLNNPNSWNPLNAAQIEPDDGDQCTGIKAFTIAEAGIAPQNFLTYFKNFSAFVIQGVFGSSDFSITRLQTDMGNVAPRSLQFVPGFGIMRLSHLGFARTDGITDKLENPEALRPYLFGGTDAQDNDISPVDWGYAYFSKAAQSATPPMYCCACPVTPNITAANATQGVVTAVMSSGGGLPSGSYYVKVYNALSTGGLLYYGEVAATGGPGTEIKVTLPSGGATGLYFLIYYGIGPGGEGEYYAVSNTGNTNTVTISQQGVLGSPGSSNGWLTRIFCYDLVLKAWGIVDLPFPISVLAQFRAVGSIPLTIMGGFWDSGFRRWQAGDTAWDAGATNAFQPSTAVQWSMRDTDVFDEGATSKLFCNQAIIRGDGAPSLITVKASINGKSIGSLPAQITLLNSTQYEARSRILQTFENMHIDISGSGVVSIESIGYEVTKKPVGSALVFS
jgi:hypothetical protein